MTSAPPLDSNTWVWVWSEYAMSMPVIVFHGRGRWPWTGCGRLRSAGGVDRGVNVPVRALNPARARPCRKCFKVDDA